MLVYFFRLLHFASSNVVVYLVYRFIRRGSIL